MTIEVCINHCSLKGYLLAGIMVYMIFFHLSDYLFLTVHLAPVNDIFSYCTFYSWFGQILVLICTDFSTVHSGPNLYRFSHCTFCSWFVQIFWSWFGQIFSCCTFCSWFGQVSCCTFCFRFVRISWCTFHYWFGQISFFTFCFCFVQISFCTLCSLFVQISFCFWFVQILLLYILFLICLW